MPAPSFLASGVLVLAGQKVDGVLDCPGPGVHRRSLVYCVFVVLFGLSLGNSLSSVMADFSNASGLRDLLWPIGPEGAVVGSLLWLIARPDRAVR
jgi:hypothetical protein